MTKRILLSISLFVLTWSFLNSSEARMVQVKESKNLSQLIRSNASDYWSWASHQAVTADPEKKALIEPWLKHKGVVMGDPHIGNFSVRQSKLASGHESLVYRVVDFDDVGQAPFVVDLARLAVATLTVNPDFKIKSIVGAYIKGLENESNPEVPPRVKRAMGLSLSKILELDKEETEDHVKNDLFKFKAGKIEPLENNDFSAIVQRLYPKAEVLSAARRVLSRGGSADAMRIWVLIGSGEERKIIELKEIVESSVSAYSEQKKVPEMAGAIFEYFMPGVSSNEFLLIEYNGKVFWVREKKAGLIDTYFSMSDKKEKREFKVLTKMAAFHLGLIHGRQQSSQDLKSEISAEGGEKTLREAVKVLSKPYVESLEKIYPELK